MEKDTSYKGRGVQAQDMLMTPSCVGAAQEQLLLPCLLWTADREDFCACLSDFAGVDLI